MDKIQKRIVEVLQNGYLMSLASVDENGPWVSDVIYISDKNLNIFFISRTEFRHSIAFLKNSQAAGAITARQQPEGQSTGVQFEGHVKTVPAIPNDALKAYSQKRGSAMSWNLGDGEAWYQFTPKKFDLIYEPLFGYTKKTLVLR